jgi:hypothetical protein
MKATDILKRFDAFLSKEESKEVKLAQMKLENGTVIEAEEFKEGEAVFIVTEDEKVPLPIGEYVMEGGAILVVTEEGVIGGAKEEAAEEEEEVEVEAEAEPQAKKVVESTVKETHFEEAEKVEESKEELAEEEKVEAGYATKEELGAAIDEIKAMIEDLKYPKKEDEEEMQESEELKAELSKPASKPLKHNPEANKTVKKQKFAKQQGGTMSRVLNRISNK